MDALPTVDDLIRAVQATTETDIDRVRAAVEAADALGARGDALVDHFVQAARTAGCSWAQIGAEMGVSKQAAQQAFVAPDRPRRGRRRLAGGPRGGHGGGPLMRPFERFAGGARAVVGLARQEARAFGHPWVGTEHLLLGILAHGEGTGAVALDRLGVTADAVRRRVLEVVGPGGAGGGRAPLTPRAKAVFAESVREAHELHQERVGTGHILLGIVAEGEGLAAQILVELGADLPRVRTTVVDVLGEQEARPR